MDEWVCTNCGIVGAEPQAGFHLMDPRYAVGYCDQCNDPHPRTPRKTPRPVHQLVRLDVFDREEWSANKDRAKLAGFIARYGVGTSSVSMSDREVIEFVALYDKYEPAGFVMPQSAREAAYKAEQALLRKKR